MIVAGCIPGGDGSLQDEASLRAAFRQHRNEIEEIRRLFAEDSHLVRVAPTFTRLQDDWSWPREDVGLTEERWAKYRELFRTASVSEGIERGEKGEVAFIMSAVGLGVSGASRGFVYSESAPAPILESFPTSPSDGVVFVRLEGNWYLYHEAS
jgi:hypothetical protein